jgi:peptidoglycan/LPS O-acetylase OafA/YrhL
MVFFNHLPLHINPLFFMALQQTFYTGVGFFFLLSGFLITYRYYDSINAGGIWKQDYFVKRFARIYPVYFLLVTIVIIINKNFDAIYLLQNYTLTHNLFFLFQSAGTAISPSWTLTVEECFYLLAPIIIFLTKRFGIALPFCISIAVYLIFLFTYGEGSPLTKNGFGFSIDSFFGRFFEFYVGIFLAKIVRKRENKKHENTGTAFLTFTAIILIALLLIPLIYVLNKETEIKYAVMLIVNNLLLPLPVGMLYFGLIFERTFIRKILSSNFFRLCGRSSYAFYLLHIPVINFIGNPLLQKYFASNYNAYVIVVLIITFFLSILLFFFYEEPMNKLIKRLFKKMPTSIHSAA